jgi:ornithine decarboxylase
MRSNAKFIFSKKRVLEEFKNIESISDIVCYSVKSNPYITSILEESTSSNFLIHHVNEIKNIKDKDKVWFMLHSPEKEELSFIFKEKINKFIVDNKNDLDFLLEEINKNNYKITLLLRMRLKEYTVVTGKYFVYGFYSKEINEIIKNIKENQLIEKIGVHFHRKTQNLSEWNLLEEITSSLSKETLDSLDFLDIGGGLPVVYKNINPKSIDVIYDKIKELKEFLNKQNIKIITEPGRSIAAPSGILETTIKNIIDDTIFIDASLFNCSMDTLVTHIKLLVKGEAEKEEGKAYTIKGLTPASEDIFRYRVYFKEGFFPKVGDKITFLNAGAYIYYTDLFNLERPKIEIIDFL